MTNGDASDDLASAQTATATSLLGCSVEIRAQMSTNAGNEWWVIDNVLVASEDATGNGCFVNETLSLTNTNASGTSTYTFTQDNATSGISVNADITVDFQGSDPSGLVAGDITFNGVAVTNIVSQSATTITFDAPTTVAGSATGFTVVLNNVVNTATEGDYNASLQMVNDAGGLNQASYPYTIGPAAIWSENFETYADGVTTAADNNTANSAVDWTIEAGAGTFEVTSNGTYLLDGSRSMRSSSSGNGLFRTWQTELIDISAYDNVSLSVEYREVGTLEANDAIDIDYRLDEGNWVDMTNGDASDDLASAQTATATSLLGCSVEIRAQMSTNAGNEWWVIDNV
ncbi:MAG: hypothetical protein MI673_01235, partial [Thiotrichales bacterium]|nr:hypothetical protein [Thiotrichales bacterium]